MIVTLEGYEIIFLGKPRKEKSLKISSKLAHELRAVLIKFLKGDVNLFMWKLEDKLGIDIAIIFHELNINHTKKPIQQWKRIFTQDKSNIIKNNINFLNSVGWVRKVDYPTWLLNVVLTNKAK